MTGGEYGGVRKELGKTATGPLQAYRSLVVGEGTWLSLLRYELITCLLGSLGGRQGITMRRLFYSLLLGKTGPRVTIGKDVVLRRPGAIRIGSEALLGEGAVLDVRGKEAGITIGDGAHVGRGAILACRGGKMSIGEHVSIGEQCRLGSVKGLVIGKHSVLGAATCLSGASHGRDRIDVPIINQPLTCKGPTRIGEEVTIGEETTVLDGVTIGSGAVIGPGSLVNRDVAEGARLSGVPAAAKGRS